ncbi:hypothetical protein Ocin01_13425 [Orchesella cincta]|uniref:Uncharacterized protein n=1 Tax=Orchesella cincta TaxID=48709 RepID=A0A1D2MJU1_ORCCI|nr:hypothetical protein Ocin01_13425 [Orchesella cincta]
MSSEYTSYYLQSLNSKLGLQTERRNRNKAHTLDNGRRVCSDFSILKNVNERNFKSATGPLYDMLPDLMTAIREPKALPNPKRLSSNRRGISQRRSSVAVKEKIAHCNSGNSKARNVCDNGSGDQRLSKVTSSVTEDHGQTTNAVYRDLLKRMAEVPEISHTKIDESSLHKNKVVKLYSHSTSTIQPSPLTSPRSTIVASKKDDPARNAIMLRTIKRGKMYGPEAIAAVSGFGITQSVIMDSSGSYTYLQIPSSSKKSTNNKEKSSSQLSHDDYDISATTPSPIDKNMWTIEKANKKLGKDKRRSIKKGYNSEDDNESKMPMPTARKMFFQAVNMHELSRSRNNLTKLTINSQNPVLHSVTYKSNSESQMPRPNDSAYEKIATSLSVPSMPVAVTSLLSGDTQQSFTSIRPTKPLVQNIMLCCKSNIGNGDMNVENFVNGKRGKMKTSRKVTRKVHNSKKKRSTKRAKRTRTRSTKPPDLRLKGPKIKGINYNFAPFQELDQDETQLGKIRTVILPFPMQKYKHTI